MAENGQRPSIEELLKEIREVTAGQVVTVFGNSMPNDPRAGFLAELLNDSVIARVEAAANTRILLDRLGITVEQWLACLTEELKTELERLKSD